MTDLLRCYQLFRSLQFTSRVKLLTCLFAYRLIHLIPWHRWIDLVQMHQNKNGWYQNIRDLKHVRMCRGSKSRYSGQRHSLIISVFYSKKVEFDFSTFSVLLFLQNSKSYSNSYTFQHDSTSVHRVELIAKFTKLLYYVHQFSNEVTSYRDKSLCWTVDSIHHSNHTAILVTMSSNGADNYPQAKNPNGER